MPYRVPLQNLPVLLYNTGWKCAASEVYGVASIPSNILVDPNGIIVAMDLRGEKVGEKLKEIYGE